MKKLKYLIIVLIILAMVLISFVLTRIENNNRLVATKTIEEENMDKYISEIDITFKKGKVVSVKESMEYEDEETAESMYSMYNFLMSMQNSEDATSMKVGIDGKKIVINMDADQLEQNLGVSIEEMTKEELKANLEENGYNVK